ncbi:MAG: hypothetical protein R3258_06350 [Acidimicrobiia bacterium]|nr:hypothetical protein [Acidimicrobiia bacterium]
MRTGYVTAHVIYRSGDYSFGFQAVVRGHGLYAIAPTGYDADLEAALVVQSGVFAHFTLNRQNDAVSGFTIWQGPFHDLLTFDHVIPETAAEAISQARPSDSSDGLVLSPSASWLTTSDVLTVDLEDFVLDVQPRSDGLLPSWTGTPGRFAEFYSVGADVNDGVLAATETAVCVVQPASDRKVELSSYVAGLVDEFRADWSSLGPGRRPKVT